MAEEDPPIEERLCELLETAQAFGLVERYRLNDGHLTLMKGTWKRTLSFEAACWFLHGMIRAYFFSRNVSATDAGADLTSSGAG